MTALRRWQEAQASIGRSGGVEGAAKRLPDRLAWLLRAIDALDDGRIARVDEVADAARASHPDIARVLDVLAHPEGFADPTRARQAAKRAGLGADLGLPFLDLFRLLVAWRVDAPRSRVPELTRASRRRAMLAAASEILATRSERLYRFQRVARWCPRAEHAQLLARAANAGQPLSVVAQFVRPLEVSLDPERWPDRNGEDPIAAWAGGIGPWGRREQEAADWAPREARSRWVSLILERIRRDLGAGRALGLADAAGAATKLVGGPSELARALFGLSVRLEWAEKGRHHLPVPLVEALWRFADLSQAQRLELARCALRMSPKVDDGTMAEILRYAMTELDAAELPILVRAFPLLPRLWIDVMVGRGQRAAFVWGLMQAVGGRPGRALAEVPALAAAELHDEAFCLFAEALAALPATRAPGGVRLEAGRAYRALRAVADRTRWLPVLAAHPRSALGPPPQEVTAGLVADPAGPVAERVAVQVLCGDVDGAAASVREEGRRLRRMSPGAAEEAALSLLADVFRYADRDGAVDAATSPLSAFVLRRGAPPLGPIAAGIVGRVGRVDGMANWHLHHAESVGWGEPWVGILERACAAWAFPDDLPREVLLGVAARNKTVADTRRQLVGGDDLPPDEDDGTDDAQFELPF